MLFDLPDGLRWVDDDEEVVLVVEEVLGARRVRVRVHDKEDYYG